MPSVTAKDKGSPDRRDDITAEIQTEHLWYKLIQFLVELKCPRAITTENNPAVLKRVFVNKQLHNTES
jgi:hypothetical protein